MMQRHEITFDPAEVSVRALSTARTILGDKADEAFRRWNSADAAFLAQLSSAAAELGAEHEMFPFQLWQMARQSDGASLIPAADLEAMIHAACGHGTLELARALFSHLAIVAEPSAGSLIELALLEADHGHLDEAHGLLQRLPFTAMRRQLLAEIQLMRRAPDAGLLLAALLRRLSKATVRRLWKMRPKVAASGLISADPELLAYMTETCEDRALPFVLACGLDAGLIKQVDRIHLSRITEDRPFWSALVGRDCREARFRCLAELTAAYAEAGLSGVTCRGNLANDNDVISRLWAEPAIATRRTDKVSIIICVHDAQDTIEYALRSICGQGYPNLQIIVVDDNGAVPLSIKPEWCNGRDVMLHRNPENVGPYVSRNIGLDLAGGDFIGFHDGDDWAHPDKISHQLCELSQSGALAHYGAVIRIRPDGLLSPENNGRFLGDGPITGLFRREAFDRVGRFASVRTRGDIEFRRRISALEGEAAIASNTIPYVLALDWDSNSKRLTRTEADWRRIKKFFDHSRRSLNLASFIERRSAIGNFIDTTMLLRSDRGCTDSRQQGLPEVGRRG